MGDYIIMLAGGLLILTTGKRRTLSEGLHAVLHGIVPIIAACSYRAMATDPHHAEQRLEPLIAAFAAAVSKAGQFSGLFSQAK